MYFKVLEIEECFLYVTAILSYCCDSLRIVNIPVYIYACYPVFNLYSATYKLES